MTTQFASQGFVRTGRGPFHQACGLPAHIERVMYPGDTKCREYVVCGACKVKVRVASGCDFEEHKEK